MCLLGAHRLTRSTTPGESLVVHTASPTTSVAAGQTEAPTAAAPAAAPAASQPFDWHKCWYPVLPLNCITHASKPYPVTLLGQNYVIWRDGTGALRAFEDMCPHRLAPLSEGRIEADGTLSCAYHGWRFNSEGRCTRIPQCEDAKAEATACASSRSCVKSYPLQERVGLLWLWPEAGALAHLEAAATPPVVTTGLDKAAASGKVINWYMRDLPYSYDILLENLTDPSHLPFSHHKLAPNLNRDQASRLPLRRLDPAAALAALQQQEQEQQQPQQQPRGEASGAGSAPAASFGSTVRGAEDVAAMVPLSGASGMRSVAAFPSVMNNGQGDGLLCFNQPISVVYSYAMPGVGMRLQTELYATPSEPGRSKVFTAGFATTPRITLMMVVQALLKSPVGGMMVLGRYLYQSQPHWKLHLFSNKLFDQDGAFLNLQDNLLRRRHKGAWKSAYYIPSSADNMVIAARRWLDEAAGGGPPYEQSEAGGGGAAAVGPQRLAEPVRLSRRQLMDRWEQHTQHCPQCLAAHARLEARAAAAKAVAVAALLALAALLGGGAVLGLGAASWGRAAAAVAVGVVAVAVLVAQRCAALLPQFSFVEFDHAHND